MLVTGGVALFVMGFLYWTVDVQRWSGWPDPLEALGRNAFAAYVLSQLLARTLSVTIVGGTADEPLTLREWLFAVAGRGLDFWTASLAVALIQLALCLGVITVLNRRRIFITV